MKETGKKIYIDEETLEILQSFLSHLGEIPTNQLPKDIREYLEDLKLIVDIKITNLNKKYSIIGGDESSEGLHSYNGI